MAQSSEKEMINKLTTKIDNFLEVMAEENKKTRSDTNEHKENLKANIEKINKQMDKLENKIKEIKKEKIYKGDNKEDKNIPNNKTVIYYNRLIIKIKKKI